MKLMRTWLLTCLLIGYAQVFWAQNAVISEQRLRQHITYLASDKLKGRGTATAEERKAAQYIAKHFRKAGLKPLGDNGTWFHTFSFRKTNDPHGVESTDAAILTSQNVVGFLDNGAAHTIVIGAHYDHLGLGYDRNSLDPNPQGKIHNGADDNASGTAGVLELARYFAKNGVRERHNFLFICFSAEELGLIGSKKYTERPTIDLEKVHFMLNMDMIGRLNQERRLMIGGVGTAPDFVPLIESLPKGNLVIRMDSSGIGPSDHASFYLKNIPVLFLFTGQHADYHKPSDDVDKINFAGQKAVLEFAVRLVEALDQRPKLTFQPTRSNMEDTPRFRVTLGIMPDYSFEGEGVQVDSVSEGKPAARAGLQRGDRIIALGDMEVRTIREYMQALSKFQKGDTTTVKFIRGTETLVREVTF
ncbi:MAG: M20/M25/M40 family metallo-hydrolase [Saprospiraceae bacterium]|nr:M20/M25/M40 family metallo-hydrolase [Saprospiraceae bacterium]MDW8484205.1 M20/M25/M40 family metallo-hydrolase [Saprospiraceae bacterium]